MKKKFLAVMLCLAMILPLFASCSNSGEKDEGERETEASQNGTSAEETTLEEIKDGIPDNVRFDGQTINILEHDRSNQEFIKAEIYSEGENGELINDAVFRRNLKIEERFGVGINCIPSTTFGQSATKSIKAGDNAYDLFDGLILDLGVLFKSGYLKELNDIPYLDFSKPWWDQRATKELSLGKKHYMNVSSANIATIQATWIVMFSKTLFKENALEDPYVLVNEGKWTLDKMNDMIKTANPHDLNGDGLMDGEDLWGLGNEVYNTPVMLVGSGEKLFSKDENDMPYISMNTPRANDVLGKVFDLVYNKSITLMAEDFNSKEMNAWFDVIIPAFHENRMLFFMTGMLIIPFFRNMEDDFGILPIPKYDEAQKEYYDTMTINNTQLLALPETNEKPELCGAFMEALSCESYKTIIPAYYDSSVKNKFLRDEESIQMLDLIMNSRCYDLGFLYNWGDSLSLYFNLTAKGNREFVSAYEKIEAKAIKDMEKTLEIIK